MKISKKLVLIAISSFVMVACVVAAITSSFGKSRASQGPDTSTQVAVNTTSSKTNIDYIIENSLDDTAAKYRVVEIGPAGTTGDETTKLAKFIANGDFKNYVVDGNKTIDDLMKEGKVEYKYFKAGDVTDDATDYLAYIANADFIYISNDKNSTYNAKNGTDINEDLYNLLHTYALSSYKPLVIENPNASTSGSVDPGVNTQEVTFGNMVYDQFNPSGRLYKTYRWDTESASFDEFIDGNLDKNSRYTGINGLSRKSKWKSYTVTADPTKTKTVAKMLIVSKDGNKLDVDSSINYNMFGGNIKGKTISDLDLGGDTYENVYTVTDSSVVKAKVYNDRYETFPDYISVEEVKLSDFTNIADFEQYDMIIVEDDCKPEKLGTATWYEKFVQLMVSNKHIIYSSKVEDGNSSSSSGGSTGSSGTTTNATNYEELYYMVATEDAISRYINVMVTKKADFNTILNSQSAGACQAIANLINNSSYRGIGGAGSSSTVFTVLEIQPCYPVDTYLANQFSYYNKPSEMVNDKAAEQIGYEREFDADGNVISSKINGEAVTSSNVVEFYDWEVSEAKIAHALGKNVNEVKVVHMSSEEFAAYKGELLGTYDMIYFGGNTSALKSITEISGFYGLTNSGGTLNNLYTSNSNSYEYVRRMPFYTMYSHNGDAVYVDTQYTGQGGMKLVTGGTPTAISPYDTNSSAWNVNTFYRLNGNDISYSNYERLKTYIDAGMPVVISDELSTSYQLIEQMRANGENTYWQSSIDPDSNVIRVLDYITQNSNGNGNKKAKALWNFEDTTVNVLSSEVEGYDSSMTGLAEVYKDAVDYPYNSTTQVNALMDLYTSSSQKPRLAVTKRPKDFNEYDASTMLTDKNLVYNFDVQGVTGNYKVNLYIDDNGNSKFEETEIVKKDGAVKTLSYQLAGDFMGPVYWKLEVVVGDSVSATTGLCYIKGTKKQDVEVLQILPGEDVGTGGYALGEGPQGANSLYFCTHCQQAYKILKYNQYADGNRLSSGALLDCNYSDIPGSKVTNGKINGNIYIGKHEHNFGIVKYDSTLSRPYDSTKMGRDDWDYNFADDVSDRFNFNIEIMYRADYEEISAAVAAEYSDDNIWKLIDIDAANKTAYLDSALVAVKAKYETLNPNTTVADATLINLIKTDADYKAEALAAAKALHVENMKLDVTTKYTAYQTSKDAAEAFEEDKLRPYLAKLIQDETNATAKSELQRLYDERVYSDLYSANFEGHAGNQGYWCVTSNAGQNPDLVELHNLYQEYVVLNDKKIDDKAAYQMAKYMASGDNWLTECFSTVIIGASEDFGGDDITDQDALDTLVDYVENDGQVILFHDTLSVFSDKGSAKLTEALRPLFGMDRYQSEIDTSLASASTYYVPIKTADPNKYYMTNLSTKPTTDTTRYATWVADTYANYGGAWQDNIRKYLSNVQYTDSIATTINQKQLPYRYAEPLSWSTAAKWASDPKQFANAGTNVATQNNTGIITTYPFTLADRLNISGTHAQVYAVDLEMDDMTVWYSLAGGSTGTATEIKGASSIYAASPNDGMDSYFIYSYGNVFYCGAGHSKVTGESRDNNDERRLYLNIICNSVRKSVMQPGIEVFDYKTTVNEKIVPDDTGYIYKIEPSIEYPVFTFKVVLDKTTISSVDIYYDLDYVENGSNDFNAATDKFIKAYSGDDISAGDLIDVGSDIAELKLIEDYFKPYDGQYTYIVIKVTDSAGSVSYKRIKIMYKDTIFNLT